MHEVVEEVVKGEWRVVSGSSNHQFKYRSEWWYSMGNRERQIKEKEGGAKNIYTWLYVYVTICVRVLYEYVRGLSVRGYIYVWPVRLFFWYINFVRSFVPHAYNPVHFERSFIPRAYQTVRVNRSFVPHAYKPVHFERSFVPRTYKHVPVYPAIFMMRTLTVVTACAAVTPIYYIPIIR